jgi:polysaccharide export outer membrane protein
MKKLSLSILTLLVMALSVITMTGCVSSKNVAYFQNSDSMLVASSRALYDSKIMPKDVLTITVSTVNSAAAEPFNLIVATPMNANLRTTATQPTLQSYIVDNEGCVNFPIVGRLHLGGMTKNEAEKYIAGQIAPYMAQSEHPIVTVRSINYKISVLGEVARPGMFTVANEKINVLEALAQAGDLTIYGVRDNVKLVRENADGKIEFHRLNLNDANLVNSPYYYLQQNDVIYVEPNKVKAQNSTVGTTTSLWFSATSILVSIASLLVNILR